MRNLHIKFTLRALLRNRNYTILNLAGLAIGLAVSIIVYLYVQDQLNYDEYVADHKHIYRINAQFELDQQYEQVAGTSLSLGPLLAQDFNYIKGYTRFLHYDYNVMFRFGEEEHFEENIAVADSNFFKVFTYPFIEGTATGSLSRPQSIVITKSFAQRYFGKEPALGRSISTNNFKYEVTGVIADLPGNIHHSFDAVISAFHESLPADQLTKSLWEATVFTFLKFDNSDDWKLLEAGFSGVLQSVHGRSR